MKIMITGGSGFIGTRLIDELLQENHEVLIYDKIKSEKYPELSIIGDVRDKEFLVSSSKNVDIIYNLAAEHADDVTPISLYSDVNIGGAKNVVEAAIKNNIHRIIFTSSVAIYGLNVGVPDESCPPNPFNEYGRTKYEAEKIFLEWQQANIENNLQIIRPAVIFGEMNRGNVYNLIKQIASNKFAMIGDGKNKKSMGYVGNISIFLASLIYATKKVDIVNFAGKNDLTTEEIVEIVQDELALHHGFISIPYFIGIVGASILDLISVVTGRKFPISKVRIQKFTADTTISTTHLFEGGFQEKYTLEDALRKMVQFEFK